MSLSDECQVTTYQNAVLHGPVIIEVKHLPTGIKISRSSADGSRYALKHSIMIDLEKQIRPPNEQNTIDM